jgi:Sulfotransferase family
VPWNRPTPPSWVDGLNAHGPAVGGAEYLVSLETDDLLAAARASTGLDDFGGVTWRPHFDVLVGALRTEASLTVAGRIVARTELLRALRQRLLLAAAWADDPTILEAAIVEPVFVVGTGRSGTSILHELLALDPANRTPRTWELLHPGEALAVDVEAVRSVGHQVHAFWAELQPAYEAMHHNDGEEPNECIFATMLEFLSDQWGGTYEVPSYSAYLVGADLTEAYRYHRKVLQTLQRRARAERWVLKAPSHLGRLRTLFAIYPDARVVQIHRDPLRTVPSTISLMGTIRSMRSETVDVDALAPWVSMGYGLMLDDTIDARASGELPDAQFVDVRYAELMESPVSTLRNVYAALGIDFPSALDIAVTDHLAAQPKGARGTHNYSLADTGLDAARERARFRKYQARYGVPDET